MGNLCKIKGMRDGIVIKLDDKADFNEVYNDMCDKFRESSNYFKNASLIIGFEGRKLTEEEENKLVDGICLNSDTNVLCVIGDDDKKDEMFLRLKKHFDPTHNYKDKQFYKGSVRSHEHLESDQTIVVLGDINPGGIVSSKGNIIILGTLYGTAHAGIDGNTSAIVVCLDMKTSRVGIADTIADITYKNSVFSKNKVMPKISFLEGREVVTEDITRDLLNLIAMQLN